MMNIEVWDLLFQKLDKITELLEDIKTNKRITKKPPKEPKSQRAWELYSELFKKRYNVDPVRNLKSNVNLCQLIDRVGADFALKVIEFYLYNNDYKYVKAMHPVKYLVMDAETLFTEMMQGRRVTRDKAIKTDKLDQNIQVAKEVLKDAGQIEKDNVKKLETWPVVDR